MIQLSDLDEEPVVIEDSASNLTLVDGLNELLQGNIILIKEYEKTQGHDVLVRLDSKGVSHISYDTNTNEEKEFERRYWNIFNVSINTLALKKVHRFDEALLDETNTYGVGDIVEYEYEYMDNTETDIALVEVVYKYNDTYYYRISGEAENILYEEDELNKTIQNKPA